MRALIRGLVGEVASAVHECGDGVTAVAQYQRLKPDWVLMDIRMEGMDGIVATRMIRAADPAARVIMVTEHGSPRLRRAAQAAGAVGFVLKDNLRELPALLTGSPREDAS